VKALSEGKISLRYSGLVVFTAKLLSVATGMAFLLMVTRSTTEQQYGIWLNVNDVLSYLTLLASALPFWITRFVARKQEAAAKTGVVANLLISLLATLVYLPLVPVITSALNVTEPYMILYFIASAQIVEYYLIFAFQGCLQAKRPQAVGYGLLLSEVFKVALGFGLIIKLQQGLLGAMLSIIASLVVQVAYYARLIVDEFKENVNWNYLRQWVKGSLANIYNLVGVRITTFIFILLFIYGGEAARGYYGAAYAIANVISYSYFLSFALYPKLLAENSLKDITTALKMVLMFAIPMTAGALAIPDSLLIILRDVYAPAVPVLYLLATNAFAVTVSQLFNSIILGVEKVDEKAKISLRELVKSKLFLVFTFPYAQSALTLPTAYYILTNFTLNQPLKAAIYVAAINLVSNIVLLIILYRVLRRTVSFSIPWKSIGKYLLASAVMWTVLFNLPHPTKLSLTLGLTLLGGIVYMAVLMAIDKEARAVALTITREFKGYIKRKPF